jgi:hypothetical protein
MAARLSALRTGRCFTPQKHYFYLHLGVQEGNELDITAWPLCSALTLNISQKVFAQSIGLNMPTAIITAFNRHNTSHKIHTHIYKRLTYELTTTAVPSLD